MGQKYFLRINLDLNVFIFIFIKKCIIKISQTYKSTGINTKYIQNNAKFNALTNNPLFFKLLFIAIQK